MKPRIVMFYPYVPESAVEAVAETLRSRWVGQGPKVDEFEEQFAQKFGLNRVVAVNTCTSALRLSLAIAGVGPGDEVITPSLTCTATNTPILEQYAKPVFADIQYETINLDPADIEHRITDKTKAILCVHWAGLPCDMDMIGKIARDHELPVIEDAAHPIGATYHSKPIGAISEFTCFSLQAIKQITSLDYDEPVILLNPKNEVEILPIGEFVEKNNYREGWKCLSFSKSGKLEFVAITGILKHEINEDLYEIRTFPSRYIKVTGTHSLFTLVNGEIKEVQVSNLKVGNYILVTNEIPSFEYLESITYGRYRSGKHTSESVSLEITPELGELLGWFVAEGLLCKTKTRNCSITFCLSHKERKEAEHIKKLLEKLFNLKVRIYEYESAIRVTTYSKGLYEFLKTNCGHGVSNKRVPPQIFLSSKDVKNAFVKALFLGDGYYREIKGTHHSYQHSIATVSKQLSYGLFYLLLQLGINARIIIEKRGERDFGAYVSKTLPVYRINWNNKSLIDAEGFRKSSNLGKRKVGDLSLIKIAEIKQVSPTTRFVYDLEIKGYENFIGGYGFALHNTGDGGVLATTSEEFYEAAMRRRWYGIDKKKRKFSVLGHDPDYDVTELGYKYNMTDIAAAIGLEQLKHFDKVKARRAEIAKRYREELENVKGVALLENKPDRTSGNWLFTMHVENRMKFAEHMWSKGVEVSVVHWRNDKYTVFGGLRKDLPDTDRADKTMISIPLHMNLTDEDVDYVVKCAKESFK